MSVTSISASLEPTDRALVELVRQDGDESAFRLLYRRHTPRLYQFALRLLGGNELDAEDIVQETWVRALEKLGTFRWQSSLRTWLTGIVINGCRELIRRKERNWMEMRDEHEGIRQPPLEHERIDLEVAMSRLPAGYRAVLVLHDVEGYTHEQISGLLEISSGTSKSQLFRARRTMRQLLDPLSAADARIPKWK